MLKKYYAVCLVPMMINSTKYVHLEFRGDALTSETLEDLRVKVGEMEGVAPDNVVVMNVIEFDAK